MRERNERAIQQLVAHEMQRQTDEAGMNLDIFVYRAAENMGKFLEDFDALDDALTEWASYPGAVGALGGDDVIVIRHREFGSEPNFTVSTSLENYFSEILQQTNRYSRFPEKMWKVPSAERLNSMAVKRPLETVRNSLELRVLKQKESQSATTRIPMM